METIPETLSTISHSADYINIENCLKHLWTSFEKLEASMTAFQPLPRSHFAESEAAEIVRLQLLNPHHSPEQTTAFVSKQFDFHTSTESQFHSKFHGDFSTIYIQTVLVSHALTEAAINTICAVGLACRGNVELFKLIDRAKVKDKWLLAPKAIYSKYQLSTDCALYETLSKLTAERNAMTHYQIEMYQSNKKVLDGAKLDQSDWKTRCKWTRRFFSLPFDLSMYVSASLPFEFRATAILRQRSPIPIAESHKKVIDSLSAPAPTPAPRTGL